MNRSVIPLFLLVLVAAIAVVALQWEKKPVVEEDKTLLSGFAEQVDKLTTIELANAQGVMLSVNRVGERWMASLSSPRVEYPVDEDQLADLVQALKRARKHEAKTRNAEKYERLGVSDISEQDSQAMLITLTAGGNSWQLLVGKPASSGIGTYVRLPQKAQSWLSDTVLGMPDAAEDWLQQPILDWSDEHIVSMSKQGEAGWTVLKTDPQQPHFALQTMPETRELKYDSVLDSVVSSVLSMRFEAIVDASVLSAETQAEAQFTLVDQDGEQLFANLFALDDNHYIQFSVEQGSAYWQEQLYQISSFSAGQLNKTVEDFLAAPPAEDVPPPVVQDEGESPGT